MGGGRQVRYENLAKWGFASMVNFIAEKISKNWVAAEQNGSNQLCHRTGSGSETPSRWVIFVVFLEKQLF